MLHLTEYPSFTVFLDLACMKQLIQIILYSFQNTLGVVLGEEEKAILNSRRKQILNSCPHTDYPHAKN